MSCNKLLCKQLWIIFTGSFQPQILHKQPRNFSCIQESLLTKHVQRQENFFRIFTLIKSMLVLASTLCQIDVTVGHLSRSRYLLGSLFPLCIAHTSLWFCSSCPSVRKCITLLGFASQVFSYSTIVFCFCFLFLSLALQYTLFLSLSCLVHYYGILFICLNFYNFNLTVPYILFIVTSGLKHIHFNF